MMMLMMMIDGRTGLMEDMEVMDDMADMVGMAIQDHSGHIHHTFHPLPRCRLAATRVRQVGRGSLFVPLMSAIPRSAPWR